MSNIKNSDVEVRSELTTGAIFAMTTNPDNNEVVTFSRATDGVLTFQGKHSTGGRDQGVDFDTQGGLTLNEKGTFLYAVNPASDTVSFFAAKGAKLDKTQTMYAGDQSLSISLSTNGFAYVLDGSVANTGIFGFKVDETKGTLLCRPTTSSYATYSNGTTALMKGDAFLDRTSELVDLALGGEGRLLYNLQRGTGGVIGWEIQEDGSLEQVGKIVGGGFLPANFGMSGLAAIY